MVVLFSNCVYRWARSGPNGPRVKSDILACLEAIIFLLLFSAMICSLESEEVQIERNRARVLSPNERNVKNSSFSLNSRSNWWQKKVDRKPTLFVNDEPIGTGVPTWREIDIYGSESRRGRSYAYRTENGSLSNRLSSSLVVTTALLLCLMASILL